MFSGSKDLDPQMAETFSVFTFLGRLDPGPGTTRWIRMGAEGAVDRMGKMSEGAALLTRKILI
jgi:hypothetical protein